MADENTQVVILKDELHLYENKKWKYDIELTERCITCTQILERNNSKPKIISLDIKDVIGCDCMKGKSADDTSAYLTIYAYPHRKKFVGKKTARSRETLIIKFNRKNSFEENQNDAKIWKIAVSSLMHGVTITSIQDLLTLPERIPKKLLVLVNPFSGPGRALQIFQQKVVPIFAEAGIHFDMVITERRNHAMDLVKSMNLGQWYGIVIVSGDGLIYEVINGLMQRPDWKKAIQIPLGCLPGGSGNALSCSINMESGEPWTDNPVLHSSVVIAKHKVRPMDLIAVDTIEGREYSFLSICWGLLADIDIESERFRSLGAARFTVEAVARVINLRQYKGKLSYLPLDGESGNIQRPGLKRSTTMFEPAKQAQDGMPPRASSLVDVQFNRDQNGEEETEGSGEMNGKLLEPVDSAGDAPRNGEITPESVQNGSPVIESNGATNEDSLALDLPPLSEPVPSNWVTFTDEFVHVSACYLPLLAPDILMAPKSRMNDGIIYLCFTRTSNTNKKQLISNLVNLETGAHLKDPSFEMVKVKAFRLEPITPNGHVCVDGEMVPYGPVQAQIIPGLAQVMTL